MPDSLLQTRNAGKNQGCDAVLRSTNDIVSSSYCIKTPDQIFEVITIAIVGCVNVLKHLKIRFVRIDKRDDPQNQAMPHHPY